MKVYKPYPGKGFGWGLGLALFVGTVTAVPMMFNLLGKPNPAFLSIMGIVFFVVEGMFVYLIWAARNLEYSLTEGELVIKWAFNTKRVPFESIRGIRRTVGNSSTKVVGVSLPGLHLGSFTNPGGKGSVNLFATRIWGEILLIRTRWEVIGITPENPEAFLEELSGLVPGLESDNLSSGEQEVEPFAPWKQKPFVGLMAAAGALFVGTGLFLRAKIPSLPAKIPMHYNLSGVVDRYGSPNEIWVPFGIGLVIAVLLTAMTGVMARNNKTSVYLMAFVSLFLAVLFSIISISMVVTA